MNDETIFMLAAALVLAAAIAAGLLWARADRTRQRRADARDRARQWPPPPRPSRPSISDAVGGAGGAGGWRQQATVRRDTPVEPLRPAYSSRKTDPIYYGDPVPLDLSSVAGGTSDPAPAPAAFEGHGGSFGGGGASGGWEPPTAAPDPSPSCSVDASPSIDCTPPSTDP